MQMLQRRRGPPQMARDHGFNIPNIETISRVDVDNELPIHG